MNILILNWRDPKNPKSGGAEIVTLEHAKAWVKAGHQVTWFTSLFLNAEKKEMIDGVQIVRGGNSFTNYLIAPFFYFSSGKYDTVIDEIHGIPYFTPLYVRGPKIIAFIHEVAGEIWDYMYPFPINILGKFFEKIYFKFYKNINFWVDAPSAIDDLVNLGISRGSCTAIPCAVSNRIVSQPPIKEKNLTFIFVSRLVKMKGIENVIQAFKYIYYEKNNAKLWIVGEGEEGYLIKLKELVDTLSLSNSVVFCGRVNDIKKLDLMRRSHLLLHASVKEGWGLVVLEAASQGTPSVVYNVNGLKDVVKNKITGIVLENNNAKDLASEALKLLQNEKIYTLLQKNGINFAKDLKWEECTRKSLELIMK